MLRNTKGIVLRSVKYGETSLILSIFTEVLGLQSYMVKGIRSEKARSKRAGLLQVASLLDLVSEHKPNRQLQHIKEFQPAYIYQSLQEEIVKNSIAVYSVELLSRLLPQDEVMEELFLFVYAYFLHLDQVPVREAANLPLLFTIRCGQYFGYNLSGSYSEDTPYITPEEGIFTAQMPVSSSTLYEADAALLSRLSALEGLEQAGSVSMNAAQRNRLLDWYLQFLQYHTQHLGKLRSPDILRTILH
ncbi:MAG: DNA repair protein RecO [Chitinophagaceae bacterium]|nr:DNA repair protein RecO [Chitinophagaceae bacterium]